MMIDFVMEAESLDCTEHPHSVSQDKRKKNSNSPIVDYTSVSPKFGFEV